MTDLMEKALDAIRHWPAERQNDAAAMLLAMDRLSSGAYRASDDELRAIDESLNDVKAGKFATGAEVSAAFAKFRK